MTDDLCTNFDQLPSRPALVVEPDDILRRMTQVRENEADAREKLSEVPLERMATVLPRARINEKVTGRWGLSKYSIEFTIRKQTHIRRDGRSTKLEHHATVEIRPKDAILSFTRRARNDRREHDEHDAHYGSVRLTERWPLEGGGRLRWSGGPGVRRHDILLPVTGGALFP